MNTQGTPPIRERLVLVHSFPTNSILLAGLSDYLSDYFELHFVDLPGFTSASPPLPRVSIDGFARYLEERIQELGGDDYLLGGISFGYLVVSRTRLDRRCRAILAIEPFLGRQSLIMPATTRLLLRGFAAGIVALGLSRRVWRSRWFRRRLLRHQTPIDRVDTLLREFDPHTYFATANLLMGYHQPLTFPARPHVLLINPADETIDAGAVVKEFESQVPQLLVLETDIEHYPRDLSKAYFAERLPQTAVTRILDFVRRAV